MNQHQLPLVTMVLFTYNQAAYIKEAVNSVLDQTYENLEIIISDDASTDDTVGVIRETLDCYQGSHVVVFNENKKNLGIGAHVNQAFQAATGELLILAAGDDISTPDRVSRTVARWVAAKQAPSAVYCKARSIDSEGTACGEYITALSDYDLSPESLVKYDNISPVLLLGACAAYTPDVMTHFGPLHRKLTVEDVPLTVRASLLGGVITINERLVDYRINVSVWLPRKLAGENFERHHRRILHRARANYWIYRQICADARIANHVQVLQAAKRRLTSCIFILRTYKRAKFDVCYYLSASRKSRYWYSSLWPVLIFSIPWLHRFTFISKSWLQNKFSDSHHE